jgi:hypothetical protein
MHITNFMELSPSSEVASCAAIQELPNILCNPNGSLLCSHEPSNSPYPEHTMHIRSIMKADVHELQIKYFYILCLPKCGSHLSFGVAVVQ